MVYLYLNVFLLYIVYKYLYNNDEFLVLYDLLAPFLQDEYHSLSE